MEESMAKEKVMKGIRNALIEQTSNPFGRIDFDSPVYQAFTDEPEMVFAREFTRVAGTFVYCENETEFFETLSEFLSVKSVEKPFVLDRSIKELLEAGNIEYLAEITQLPALKAAITRCEYLIARLGSIMVSSAHESGRRLNVFPEIHIVVAYTSQIVNDLKDALTGIKERYVTLPSMVTVITGPSRTADIEKTLVMGAHGPKELVLFLIED